MLGRRNVGAILTLGGGQNKSGESCRRRHCSGTARRKTRVVRTGEAHWRSAGAIPTLGEAK